MLGLMFWWDLTVTVVVVVVVVGTWCEVSNPLRGARAPAQLTLEAHASFALSLLPRLDAVNLSCKGVDSRQQW